MRKPLQIDYFLTVDIDYSVAEILDQLKIKKPNFCEQTTFLIKKDSIRRANDIGNRLSSIFLCNFQK